MKRQLFVSEFQNIVRNKKMIFSSASRLFDVDVDLSTNLAQSNLFIWSQEVLVVKSL